METPTTSGTSVVAEDFERSTRVELLEKRLNAGDCVVDCGN
jgi:hypothetical protein